MSKAKSTPKTKPAAPAVVAEQEVMAETLVVTTEPVKTPTAPKKPVAKKVAAPVTEETVVVSATVKPAKVVIKKPKLIRDSFTFPENDYALLDSLKLRALANGHEIKKSELLRAGLIALQGLADGDLVKLLATVERIKTGRPSKK